MGRGKSFNHKKKGHPGEFPKGSEEVEAKKHTKDREFLVTHEAYKNRVSEE